MRIIYRDGWSKTYIRAKRLLVNHGQVWIASAEGRRARYLGPLEGIREVVAL